MEKESHDLKSKIYIKMHKNQQSNLVEVELYLITFSDSDYSGLPTISSEEKMHLKHSSLRPFIFFPFYLFIY